MCKLVKKSWRGDNPVRTYSGQGGFIVEKLNQGIGLFTGAIAKNLTGLSRVKKPKINSLIFSIWFAINLKAWGRVVVPLIRAKDTKNCLTIAQLAGALPPR
jgi:ABC-type uncharacterized transport system permease subunit